MFALLADSIGELSFVGDLFAWHSALGLRCSFTLIPFTFLDSEEISIDYLLQNKQLCSHVQAPTFYVTVMPVQNHSKLMVSIRLVASRSDSFPPHRDWFVSFAIFFDLRWTT